MELPGQPKHPEVLDVAEKLTTKIHAAGRKLTHEVMAVARGDDIFFEGVKAFREQSSVNSEQWNMLPLYPSPLHRIHAC